MCWNAEVSLQTFVFASVSFILGYFFQFPLHKLIFFIYFSSVQLFEHFVWKNIDNKGINESLSKFGYWLITLMPAFALLLIPDSKTRLTSISLYITFILLYTLYKYPQLKFVTDKGKNGHLRFNFIPAHGPYSIAWLLFFFKIILLCLSLLSLFSSPFIIPVMI